MRTKAPIDKNDIDQNELGKFKLEGIATQKKIYIFIKYDLYKTQKDNLIKFKGITKTQKMQSALLNRIK